MFAKFRKHHKWIWIFLLVLVIPSFVIFFYDVDPVDLIQGNPGVEYDFGSIDGQAITRGEYLPVQKEVRIRSFLRTGGREWPGTDQETQERILNETVQRLFLIQKMEEMGIEASTVAIGRLANQQLQQIPIAQFEEQVLRPQGLTQQDYQNYLRHEIGLQQLFSAVTLSGKLVDPQEAEELFREEHENIHTEAALFTTSNYLDNVTLTPDALRKFYTDQSPRYRIPNRVRVSYVTFDASSYTNEAVQRLESNTNLTELIERVYAEQGPETFKDTNDVVMTEEAAKEKIKTEHMNYLALVQAEREANVFANDLLKLPQPNQADDLEKLAAAKGLSVQVTEAFNYREGLEDAGFPPEFRQQAMQLNAQTKPLQIQPIVGTNAVYLISLKEEIPSELPPFETVQPKVTEDYKMTEARKLASAAATGFIPMATNQLAAGVAFNQVCEAAGATHVDLVPFSPGTTPPLEGLDPTFNLRTLQRTVMEMKAGDISQFLPSRDGGYVLYVAERTPVEPSKVQEELPEFTENLRQYRQNQAFDAWFRKAAEQSALTLPQREEETAPPATQTGG